jgi:hypothetical protein
VKDDQCIKLADACQRLKVEYNRLHRAVLSGRVRGERDAAGNRWLVRVSDLPAIAKALGLAEGTMRRT